MVRIIEYLATYSAHIFFWYMDCEEGGMQSASLKSYMCLIFV